MEKAELIFIPWPTMGHLAQLVELAKLIITKNNHFSITVLIIKLPESIDPDGGAIIDSFVASSTTKDLHFLYLLPPTNPEQEWSSRTRGHFINRLLESHKPQVKYLIDNSLVSDYRFKGSKITGFVVDMLCTTMIDVADEFVVPCYVFFASGAGFLSLMLHFQTLQDVENRDVSEFLGSSTPVAVPGFANPIPSAVLPLVFGKQSWLGRFLHYARGYRRAKGIIINSFLDLELNVFNSITISRIYPIGPILNQAQNASSDEHSETMKWLEEQPPQSVIYVCFGSQGSLDQEQVKELAKGLEKSGYRFLCSLRRPSSDNTRAVFPSEYENHKEVLPEGFLDRTASIGKVVGWVPQLAVLSEPAVGGFISHCGWNSVLESIWCGVPIATWPLHSEQKLNAFQLVKELGLAVEISLDYQERRVEKAMITAEAIEKGIRSVMQRDSEVRKKVKETQERSRMSVMQEGSSYETLGDLIDNLLLEAC